MVPGRLKNIKPLPFYLKWCISLEFAQLSTEITLYSTLLSCVYYWDTYERREIDEQKHIIQLQKNTDFLLQTMIPAYNKKRCTAVPFETGIHFRRKTDFFPEEDTTKSYSGFEPEPIRL
ncbi:hypothetical protein TNCV_4096521 [Trichonephila clavipes]|nr:hypothetical protein TNCV_4096521 [Trichonephila clavipes]